MKKIISCLLIMCLTISVYALPTTADNTPTKKQAFKALTMRKAENALEMRKVEKKSNLAVEAEEMPTVHAYQSAAKSQEAEIDTIDLYFEQFYNDPIYYDVEVDTIMDEASGKYELDTVRGGDWYIVLKNERYQFIFDYYNMNPYDCTGTYTIDDMDVWAWAAIPEADGHSSYYDVCDLTVTAEKVSENLTLYSLSAFVTVKIGWEGEVYAAFHINAEHRAITPNTIIETAFTEASITPDENMFTIAAHNDSIDMTMPLFSDFGVQGYYTESHIDIDNCQLIYNEKEYTPMDMEAVITTADLTTGGVAYVAFMEILTTDTTFFNIVLQAPITPIDTVEMVCNNLVLDDSYGFEEKTIYFKASNKEYSIWGAYNDTEIRPTTTVYEGTASAGHAGVEITKLATKESFLHFSTKLTVTPNRKGGHVVYMETLGSDHVFYTARLAWEVPTPTETVDLNFEKSAKAYYYPYDEFGNNVEELQLANYDGRYSVSFDVMNSKRVMEKGTFTLKDLFEEQSFIVKHSADGEDDENVSFADLQGELYQSGDSTILKASVIGFDSVQYNINMFYAAPAPEQVVTYEFSADETEFTNALTQGLFKLESISKDENLIASVLVISNSIAGTYVNDGKFEQSDFMTDQTYVQVYNEETEEYDQFLVMKGQMVVTVDEEKNIKAVAEFICENAVQYNLTFHAPYERVRLPYDNQDNGVNHEYTDANSTIVIEDFIDGYNIIYVNITDNNMENAADLYFYATEMDPVIGIPEGQYPINDTEEPGTMLASRGVLADGQTASPSYFLTLIEIAGEEGFYVDETWWMVDGVATVKNDNGKLQLTIDAVNSYDLPVKISYHGSITPVDNVEVESNTVQKRIIDGQLVILKNGKTYTIMGAEMK